MGGNESHELEEITPPTPDSNRIRILSIDPRSPSNEITRTPIIVDKTPDRILQGSLDPRSPTNGIDRTPLSFLAHAKSDSALATVPKLHLIQYKEDHACLSDNGVENDLSLTGIEDMSLEDFPTDDLTQLAMDGCKNFDDSKKIKIKKNKEVTVQPKQLFPTKKSSNLPEVTRSPLSTRTLDMNSPLTIVQRKQIKDIDRKMTCAQENSMSRFIVRDKENM